MHALLIALLAAAPAAGATPDELELLRQSLVPAQRASVEAGVHGLGTLPLYRVVASIDTELHTFHGDEQIRVPLSTATSELVLRVFNNAPYVNHGSPSVLVSDVSCPDQSCKLVEDKDRTVLHVVYAAPLAPGSVAAVNLTFKGIVPELPASATSPAAQLNAQVGLVQNHGGPPTDHGAFGAGLGVLALTGLFPQLASRGPAGWDLTPPSGVGDVASYDLSNYLVTLEAPGNATVVAGGARLGEEPTPAGTKRSTFAAAAVRDFPVYAGTRWKVTTAKAGAVQVTAYTLPGDEGSAKTVLGVATRAITDFSQRFGAYPWTQFSVVEQALADGAGGIEYPTVVGVASLLYRPQMAFGGLAGFFGPQQKLGSHAPNIGFSDKLLEFAVAHEVAHQWWSSLIGSDPHRHPVVDEPLTQYSAALYVEAHRGKAAAEEALRTQVAMNFQMMRQAGENDAPADQPTDAFASPLQYAGLIYGKAPLFYRAARKLLGDQKFNAALKHYGESYRFREAGPDAFLLAAVETAPGSAKALQTLRTRWLDEAHGDEDVGPLDLGKVVEGMTGMHLSAEERAAIQEMMPMMMQMMKNGVDPSQNVMPVDPTQSGP